MSESKPRARSTLEFKLEALKLVKDGQVAAVTAKILGIPKQRLDSKPQEVLTGISGLRRAGRQHKRLLREYAAQRS